MKLDPQCTIAVLAAIEDAVSCSGSFVYASGDAKPKGLEQYSDAQIAYHVNQCDLSGYLIGCQITGNGGMVFVEDLHPRGHEALANSRKSNSRQAIKDIASEAGKAGIIELLKALITIAKGFLR